MPADSRKRERPDRQAGASDEPERQTELFEAAVPPPSYHGHRKRLRTRFMQGGADAIPDYELLELVLFRAFQRQDTKDLAKRLLARFGSFAEVINAPDALIKEIDGASDRVVEELKIVRAAALRLMQRQVIEKPLLGSWNQVIEYCRAASLACHDTTPDLIAVSQQSPARLYKLRDTHWTVRGNHVAAESQARWLAPLVCPRPHAGPPGAPLR